MTDTKFTTGDEVTVVLHNASIRLPALGHNIPDTITYQGIVQSRADYDDADSIRITGDATMPVRVLAFKHIVSLNDKPFKYTPAVIEPKKNKKEKSEIRTVEVEGSKGNKYTLTIRPEGGITCSCPGFGFNGKCKHVTNYKA